MYLNQNELSLGIIAIVMALGIIVSLLFILGQSYKHGFNSMIIKEPRIVLLAWLLSVTMMLLVSGVLIGIGVGLILKHFI